MSVDTGRSIARRGLPAPRVLGLLFTTSCYEGAIHTTATAVLAQQIDRQWRHRFNKLSPRGLRDPADGSSTRGGSSSVRGRVRSPHMAKLQAASVPTAYGSCVPRASAPWDRQTDGSRYRLMPPLAMAGT